ncbi:MAG: alpha/beta hydrolase-fold protein [Candidimonas sp.]
MLTPEIRTIAASDGQAYRLSLVVPSEPAPRAGWPVAYILGEESLLRLLDEADKRASGRRDGSWPAAVLVGIGYPGQTRREFDYTPRVDGGPGFDREQPSGTGGAQAFLSFIQAELRPLLALLYSVDVQRQYLLGHSLGGLFVLDTMLRQPEAFRAYVSSSASVWWADRYLQRRVKQAASGTEGQAAPHAGTPSVWMSVGEYEQSASPEEFARNDPRLAANLQRRQSRRMVDGNRELAGLLADEGLASVRFQIITGATHGTSVGPAMYWGLRGALGE